MKLIVNRLLIIIAVAMTFTGLSVFAASEAKFVKFVGNDMILCSHGHESVARNPKTEKKITFWFVNNMSSSSFLGTFESPFNNLAAAQNAAKVNDIIYLFYGDGHDTNQNAGIILQYGQQLLGGGICQEVKTKQGEVKIPPQSSSLPVISNTLVTDPTGLAAVRLNAGNNVVSGLNIMDNLGIFPSSRPLVISSALQIDTGEKYTIKNNTMSSFDARNPLTLGGGEVVTILGGGCIEISKNIFQSRNDGDVYGIVFENTTSLFGNNVVKKNLFAGIDSKSGFVQAFHYDNSDFSSLQTTSCLSLTNNIFASSFNSTAPSQDTCVAIELLSEPAAANTVTFIVTENFITLPAGIPQNSNSPLGGLVIAGFGPGTTSAKVSKNVATNSYGVPDYFFLNFSTPSSFKVCFKDNIGTRQDLIIAGEQSNNGASKGRRFRNTLGALSSKMK